MKYVAVEDTVTGEDSKKTVDVPALPGTALSTVPGTCVVGSLVPVSKL